MRICIDSSILIPSLQESDPAAMHLLDLVGPELTLMIPRLVAQEVTRNLKTTEQMRRFYRLFQAYDFAFVVDEPVPRNLVVKYTKLGLPEKADAFLGAFAEWMNVRYLVSSNRHFLRELQTDVFDVLDAAETPRPIFVDTPSPGCFVTPHCSDIWCFPNMPRRSTTSVTLTCN